MQLVTPLEMMKLEDLANKSGVSYDQMMDAAGNGLAEHLTHFALEHSCNAILFLCGNGNNGGDCFVAASKLSKQFSITVCLVSGVPKTRTAYTKYRLLKNVTILSEQDAIRAAVAEHQLIVDGVFGIGFRGELSPFMREIFRTVNQDPDKNCIAVDIPSGGNGLNGAVAEDTPHCIATITFGAAKSGLFLAPLSEHCGAIYLSEIDIPESAFQALTYPVMHISSDFVREKLPNRPANSHKGNFGRILFVCGSRSMPGAAVLAVQAALRCGVGTCVLASEPDACRNVIAHAPESMLLPLPTDPDGYLTQQSAAAILKSAESASCVVIGCGLGQTEGVRQLVLSLIPQLNCPIILDADGLNVIASRIDILQKAKVSVTLTPHPGEMARLLRCSVDEIQKDRLAAAKRLANRYPNTVVVLKGAGTIVAVSDHASVNTNGNSGMSKGGSGDVLAGMIGSLTAQGISPETAAEIGVFLHGLAGDCAAAEFSRRAMLPSDLIRQLPLVFGDFE
ncbi:MAG TPA: bifunctional ADP-dependent NAD(P)H-hydrate dehydratase/NAD(P)H-hydrate epimerase [Ruminococcus sp.]|nr:bifunctional ADP-dependent NAD(P)H-hydrate dehydratase/NAD(P)H-hydrate epimerase [Ruminococcus sp.]